MKVTVRYPERQCAGACTQKQHMRCTFRQILYANIQRIGAHSPYFNSTTLKQRYVTHATSDVASAASTSREDSGGGNNKWIEVGIVGPTHGVRGEFKVQPLTDFPEDRLGEPGPRWLQAPVPKIARSPAPPPAAVELEWGRSSVYKGRELWIVKLEDVDSPEEAAEIRGHILMIPADARDELEDEDEFYMQDLLGLRVLMDSTGELVGKVVDLFDGTGTHDVLRIEVAASFEAAQRAAAAAVESSSSSDNSSDSEQEETKPKGKRQVMLPFAKALVPIVDLKAGFMRVQPPDGLFDLATEVPVKQRRRENAGKKERRKPRGEAGGVQPRNEEQGAKQ